jgi:hypothetical protein
MPGLGPSLLPEFLADGPLRTQPERCLTEGVFMVQPPPAIVPVTGPASQHVNPPRPLVTGDNHERFSSYLHRLSGRIGTPQETLPLPESCASPPPTVGKELSLQADPSGSLAPDEQPSLGGQGADPLELLALINPMGGVEAAVPVAPAPPTSHPGVAEVAELVERWVRRVALGGDQRRAAVRLDIGQGRFSGAELLVVAEAGRVSVELQLPSSVSGGDLSERLRARLERRGYAADVSVR